MRRVVVAPLLALLVTAACANVAVPTAPAPPSPSASAPGPTATRTTATRTTAPVPAGDGAGAGSLAAEERSAVQVVDEFWQRHFAETGGTAYTSPRVVGGYSGATGPSCGGEPAAPGNAFYCPAGDFLAWDEELMAAGYQQIGDGWVYLVIAHEWGHAIQARLARDQVSVAAELQADCLAGAALQGAADDGLLTVEVGDAQEIARTLVAVADDYPWTDTGSHGDAQQRTAAFSTGASGGVQACV